MRRCGKECDPILIDERCKTEYRNRWHIRSLTILASTPHDHVCGTRLCPQIPLIYLVALSDLLEQPHSGRSHAAEIAPSIGRHDTEQALSSFFGKVWLLEKALSAVDVWKVECRAAVAGVEYGRQADAR